MAAFRILVIDDSDVILAKVKSALTAEGYEVTTTTQAVGNARHIPNVDLVIIDFHMPGIDGGTVVQSLRQAAGDNHPALFYLYSSDASLRPEDHAFDGVISEKGDDEALVRQVRAIVRIVQLKALRPKK
ncbi:MAG: response regulator [Polyangiaceae bacterium]